MRPPTIVLFAFVVLVSVGCTREADTTHTSDAPPSAVTAADSTEEQDSVDRSDDDPAWLYDDPLELVLDYVRQDSAGFFRRYSPWLDSLLVFESPGWDYVTVVTGYDVGELEVRADTTIIVVHYDVAGLIHPITGGGGKWGFFPQEVVSSEESFKLVQEGERWLIAAPVMEPHLFPAVAEAAFSVVLDSSVAQLRALKTR
jgi:hypothetical protein